MEQGQERVQRSGHPGHFGEDIGGAMRLGDLGIGEALDVLHGGCRMGSPAQRFVQEQPSRAFFRLVDSRTHPSAEQAIAAAQMMVQETERRAHREGVQPQRNLGQFHCHRVFIHAVHAALEHHAPNDMPVVKPRPVEGPAPVIGVGHNRVADRINARCQRRNVAFNGILRFGHGRDHAIGQVVHEVH